jgi:hypothetical protein
MGRETGTLQLLASLLLTGGKGADLVIRGNVVLINLVTKLPDGRTKIGTKLFLSLVPQG